MTMYYGEGRLFGNIGTYAVVDASDEWNAERLLRNATAMKEQVRIPKLQKASLLVEESIYTAIEGAGQGKGVYSLGGGDVYFFEFVYPDRFE